MITVKRVVEQLADVSQESEKEVSRISTKLFSMRLRQTMEPGLKALESLGEYVGEWETVSAVAIGRYDSSCDQNSSIKTFRDRIQK